VRPNSQARGELPSSQRRRVPARRPPAAAGRDASWHTSGRRGRSRSVPVSYNEQRAAFPLPVRAPSVRARVCGTRAFKFFVQGNQEIRTQALRAREVSVACVCVCATSSLLCASPVPSLSAVTGRRKDRCVDCGGKSLCQHQRQKQRCKVRACCRRPCTPSVCACVCVCLRVRACVCTKIPHNRSVTLGALLVCWYAFEHPLHRACKLCA